MLQLSNNRRFLNGHLSKLMPENELEPNTCFLNEFTQVIRQDVIFERFVRMVMLWAFQKNTHLIKTRNYEKTKLFSVGASIIGHVRIVSAGGAAGHNPAYGQFVLCRFYEFGPK